MNKRYRLYNATARVGWPALALLALLIGAAWIEPLLVHRSFPRALEIGGEDLGLAQGWSAKEVSDTLPGPHGAVSAAYRWSGPSSNLVFTPSARQQAQAVTLRLLSGRPDNRAVAPVHLLANGRPIAAFAVGPLLRRYHFFVPGALAGGESLTLRLDSPTFRPADDANRQLGVIGLDARIAEVGAAPWLPRPTLPLFVLGLAALLLANGQPVKRAVPLAALALAALVGIGFYTPAATLAAARTLVQLLLVAALVVGGARWWRRSGPAIHYPWRWGAALLILVTILTLTPTMSADGVEYYAYLRSLAVDHDLEFTNEYKGPEVPFERVPTWLAANRTQTGYAGNLASVGPAIVWAPFYVIGDAIARIGKALGLDWTTDGYSLPYIAMINLASAVSLPITVWLCYLIARRVADRRIALLAAVALVAGSAIVDYGLFEAHYPHALAAATVAAYFYWWLRTRPDRSAGQWVVLGLLAGLMALMYWINAILVLLPALDLLPNFWHALRARNWRALGAMVGHGLIFLAATLLAFSPQMIAWQILYGSPFTIPHGASFAEPRGFKALEMLFSPEHGQLLWAPITCVGMIGMGWYIARRRWEGLLVLLAFTLYFLYNATLSSWHGGGPFGLRRIVNVLPLLAPGLACLLVGLGRRWREAPLTLCVLCLAWNAALLLRYLTYLIPHNPGELALLSVGEFVLAPNNLPWYEAGPVVGGALFPRLLIQGAGKPVVEAWAPLGLLLVATILLLIATIAVIARLHDRFSGRPRGGAPRPAKVPAASEI